jgi:hypothetical protein
MLTWGMKIWRANSHRRVGEPDDSGHQHHGATRASPQLEEHVRDHQGLDRNKHVAPSSSELPASQALRWTFR